VSVTIEPQGAIDAGAQWRMTVGPDTGWHDSGDVISSVPVATYTIRYRAVYGWERPANQSVEVTSGGTATTTGTYVSIVEQGSVSVTIEPQGAIDAGAQWRMTVGPDTGWHDSGDVISNVSIGSYIIRFRNIADWIKPDNQNIEVVDGATASTIGTYLVSFNFPVGGNFNPTNFINAIPAWGCDPQGENCEGGINWETVPANNPHSSDPTALEFTVYFPPNPYMDPNATEPVQAGMNYTTPFPWIPIDLTGATKLTFWAKGDGNEVVRFGMGGLNLSGQDSHSVDTQDFVLTQEWQQFTIDLTGADLSSINGGFRFVGTFQPPYSGYVGEIGTIYIGDAVYSN
ncbi:MAG: hypothetical protein K8S27_10920, partial [Candidatus Omnitrophica bacterium]|nr:hypothetical protein [Candidatus Omnitrophota bacterium]